MTWQCLKTALCIGLVADCDMRAGAAWLESPQRRGHARNEELNMDDVLARLRNMFREYELDELESLRDPERTSLSASAFACAARIAQEYKLGLWVRSQNLAGASVRTPRLISAFQLSLETQPPPVELKCAPLTENSTGRNWAFRWRRSQGAIFAKIRTEEAIDTPAKRDKARE